MRYNISFSRGSYKTKCVGLIYSLVSPVTWVVRSKSNGESLVLFKMIINEKVKWLVDLCQERPEEVGQRGATGGLIDPKVDLD